MIQTLIHQILIMFILCGCGFVLFRTGKITLEGSRCIGNILIYLVLPCVVVNSFLVERTSERLIGFAISALLAFILLVVSTVISTLFFRKDGIAVFASSYSNPGFFGMPLIIASLSDGAVFYVASFIAFLNIFQWTYGVYCIKKSKEMFSFKKLMTAPFIVAMLIGFFFFLTGCQMPELLKGVLTTISATNTPLAMFTIGVYLAQTELKKMLTNTKVYLICLSRLIIIPAISLGILFFVPSQYEQMKLALMIAAACPVGANVAVYAQLHGGDYSYAVEAVVISTLCSAFAIPVIATIAMRIF